MLGFVKEKVLKPKRVIGRDRPVPNQSVRFKDSSFSVTSFDGTKLACRLFLRGDRPCIVYCHSFGHCKEEGLRLLPDCDDRELSLALVDQRGCGESGEGPITFGHCEKVDLLFVLFYLASKHGVREFFLWGRSMGTTAVINLLALLSRGSFGEQRRWDGDGWAQATSTSNSFGLFQRSVSRNREDSAMRLCDVGSVAFPPGSSNEAKVLFFLETALREFGKLNPGARGAEPLNFSIGAALLDSPFDDISLAAKGFIQEKVYLKFLSDFAVSQVKDALEKELELKIDLIQPALLSQHIGVRTVLCYSQNDGIISIQSFLNLHDKFGTKATPRAPLEVAELSSKHGNLRTEKEYALIFSKLFDAKNAGPSPYVFKGLGGSRTTGHRGHSSTQPANPSFAQTSLANPEGQTQTLKPVASFSALRPIDRPPVANSSVGNNQKSVASSIAMLFQTEREMPDFQNNRSMQTQMDQTNQTRIFGTTSAPTSALPSQNYEPTHLVPVSPVSNILLHDIRPTQATSQNYTTSTSQNYMTSTSQNYITNSSQNYKIFGQRPETLPSTSVTPTASSAPRQLLPNKSSSYATNPTIPQPPSTFVTQPSRPPPLSSQVILKPQIPPQPSPYNLVTAYQPSTRPPVQKPLAIPTKQPPFQPQIPSYTSPKQPNQPMYSNVSSRLAPPSYPQNFSQKR